jgi:hypothetical protein
MANNSTTANLTLTLTDERASAPIRPSRAWTMSPEGMSTVGRPGSCRVGREVTKFSQQMGGRMEERNCFKITHSEDYERRTLDDGLGMTHCVQSRSNRTRLDGPHID